MKRLLVVFTSFLLILTSILVNDHSAKANTISPESNQSTYEFVPENTDEFIKECSWEKPTPDAKLVKVVHDRQGSNVEESNEFNDITPMWATGYYIKKVGGLQSACGSTIRARATGTGDPVDGVLTLSQTVGVSNKYSVGVDVGAEIITASVGFDVTDSWSMSAQFSVNTKGKRYQIVAYDDYLVQNFEVWNDPIIGSDYQVASGYASKVIGFCYAVWEL